MRTRTLNKEEIFLEYREEWKKAFKNVLFTKKDGTEFFDGDDVIFFLNEKDFIPTQGILSSLPELSVWCWNVLLNKWKIYKIGINVS